MVLTEWLPMVPVLFTADWSTISDRSSEIGSSKGLLREPFLVLGPGNREHRDKFLLFTGNAVSLPRDQRNAFEI